MGRNTVISVCKGIAIILMVIGHAEAPELITNFIYTFHMPVFFITAGYFFSRKYLDDPWEFCRRRFKGLYIPFLKWSILFLLLHNLWFEFDILNETYGNWENGVTHPYSWHQAMQRLVLIVFSMSGYDEFMAGAFWFFRGLLLASIFFIVLYRIIENNTPLKGNKAVLAICGIALAFTVFRISNGLKINTIPNGGMREIWGMFFFGIGVLYKRFESMIKEHWALSMCYFALLCGAAFLHLSGMNNSGKLRDVATLPLTGTIGFLMLHHISAVIDARGGLVRSLLVHIGDNTLYVFVFHIISYKLVSLLKIHYYGLDFKQIGCHMVIHYNHTDFFWVLYSVVGVAVPLCVLALWRFFTPMMRSQLSGLFSGFSLRRR